MSRRFEPLADDRQSIRLPGYDYTRAGAYFVTVCVAARKRILGSIRCGVMRVSEAGRAAEAAWYGLPAHYPHVRLDAFVVMPNHVHGIVMLDAGMDRDVGTVGAGRFGASGDGRGEGQAGAGRFGASGDGRGAGQVGAGRFGASGDGRGAGQVGAGRFGASGDGRGAGQVGAGLRPAPAGARATIPTSGGAPSPPRRHALPEIVRAFKSFSARAINIHRGTPGALVWQRNYYERIVRDVRHLKQVRRYILENPAAWGDDHFR